MASRFIVFAIGTRGDVYPLVELAKTIKAIGHSTTIMANSYFKQHVLGSSLDFYSTGKAEEYIESHCSLNKEGSLERMQELFKSSYFNQAVVAVHEYILQQKARYGDKLVVGVLGSNNLTTNFCKKNGVRIVVIHLYPSSISGITPWPYRNLGYVGKKLYWLCGIHHMSRVTQKPAYQLIRQTLSRYFFPKRHLEAATTEVALFPEWFMLGDLQNEVANFCGFPLQVSGNKLEQGLMDIINKNESIIIFMCGSGVYNEQSFYRISSEIVNKLQVAAVFVNPNYELIKEYESSNIYVSTYVDHVRVFPHMDLIVHHGGIGTCAAAINASSPQLIRPLSYDQPDNGWRVTKLGVGSMVTASSYSNVDQMADHISAMMKSTKMKECILDARKKMRSDKSMKASIKELMDSLEY